VLIGIGIVIVFFLASYFIIASLSSFKYEGVKFERVKEGSLLLYKTSIPVLYQGQIKDYNFYLRNDPRELEGIGFDGKINLMKNVVINMSEDIKCDGDEVIGVVNLRNLYDILGADVIKDPNASCDSSGMYMFLQIQENNVTNIEQVGPACYNINLADKCDILKVAEKFMVETFIEFDKVK